MSTFVNAGGAGQIESVGGGGAHGDAGSHDADAGESGGVAIDAAAGGDDIFNARADRRWRKDRE